MTKILLLASLILFSTADTLVSNAQTQTSISENFDVKCATSTSPLPSSSGWLISNPIPATFPDGAWMCTASGNGGTPGMQCSGYYSSTAHLDTSYLISPLLNLASYYPNRIFLRFDTKTTKINNRAKLSVLTAEYPDSFFVSPLKDSDLSWSLMPVIGMGDSSGWVTHQVELTTMETLGPVYVAFRYISTTTSVSTWYLDNINTTPFQLDVLGVPDKVLPLAISGNSSGNTISLSLATPGGGKYDLVIYDMIGRTLHQQVLNTVAGYETYSIPNLDLRPGMYCVKVGNNSNYGFAKVVVQ